MMQAMNESSGIKDTGSGNGPRVALVGCGSWGKHILRDLRILGCEVPVVAISAESMERARKGGADMIVSAIPDLPPVDGYVVAVPTSLHAETIQALLPANRPIFCEKPMTADVQSARKIVEQGGDRLYVMDKWRYHPGIERLAEYARGGELGKLIGIDTVRQGWGNPHDDVNPVWVLAPHDLSIILEIGGELPPLVSSVADQADGNVFGLRAHLQGSFWATIDVGTRSPTRRRVVTVHFEQAVVVLPEGVTDHLLLARNPVDPNSGGEVKVEKEMISTEFPLLRELRRFVEHITHGAALRTTADEALQTVICIDKMLRQSGAMTETGTAP